MLYFRYGLLNRSRMLLYVGTIVSSLPVVCTFQQLLCALTVICFVKTVQFPLYPTSESADDKTEKTKDDKYDKSENDDSGVETEVDDAKDKKMLDVALKTVLDPNSVIIKKHDIVDVFKDHLDELERNNKTAPLEWFMEEMDNLSLEVCKTSQEALWAYVTDINNDTKKNKMIRIAAEEDEIKKHYWAILKKKYLLKESDFKDPKMRRKIRIIKERGTNVQMPQSKQREEIDTMQRIWSRVTVCAYNESTTCNLEDSMKTISDVITIFKNSSNSKELAYYWKAYRDTTGRKIRPIFKDYVSRMNAVAQSENFTDAGQMWRYAFEDDNFTETVARLWSEIKPLYTLLHDYVRIKLKNYYNDDLKSKDNLIPAHLLGNIWAQEWQSIFNKVIAYPDFNRPEIADNDNLTSKSLFNAVDEFHQSLGFESSADSYQDIKETMATANCLPSSHDMCDGVHYKIKWCGEKITDVAVGLSRAARLLGHVQYFKHYRNLPPLYRDGPNPAFHDAISDIVAIQMTSPNYLTKFVNFEVGPEVTINHLLWLSLEKFPLMAYAYALDKWRWDVFGNSSIENWNQHWWDLRIHETGISPPVPRNESDLDPAAKYHVVSHVQYITYLISHVLEFQIMLSLCRRANHTGPLHECSIHGVKEAGKLLSEGMALGASEDWRTVLRTITGKTELSTEGILQYFSVLENFLRKENAKFSSVGDDMDKSIPIIVGVIVVILTLIIVVMYCVKKYNLGVLSMCGLTKNGSLDIATNELPQRKSNDVEVIREEKV